MNEQSQYTAMLDLMLRPAFLVRDGVIVHANAAAGPLLLRSGMPIEPLILHGKEEYAAFVGGQLYLTLCLGDMALGCTVADCPMGDIFLPEAAQTLPQLQAFSLASVQLRQPLTGLLGATEQIFSQLEDPHLRELAAQANRRLQQLQRAVSNMSDAAAYAAGDGVQLEYTRVDSFLAELLQKAEALIAQAGRTLRYELQAEGVYTLVDRQKLERALMNMLSNALKFTPEQEPILVQLQQNGKKLYLRVTGGRDPQAGDLFQSAHGQFLRQPALEDPRLGIGLGMVLMRSVAAMHHGALLMDRPDELHDRVTLTLDIRQAKQDLVKSPVLAVDYAGHQDHLLMELSDVLPSDCYDPGK